MTVPATSSSRPVATAAATTIGAGIVGMAATLVALLAGDLTTTQAVAGLLSSASLTGVGHVAWVRHIAHWLAYARSLTVEVAPAGSVQRAELDAIAAQAATNTGDLAASLTDSTSSLVASLARALADHWAAAQPHPAPVPPPVAAGPPTAV